MRAGVICGVLALVSASAGATTLRQQYETCVTNAYLDLLVEGRPNAPRTAEAAVQSCETELRQIESLLINTNMEPRQAFWIVTAIRASAKRRLLQR